jgi:excisionase family DNA binding protein
VRIPLPTVYYLVQRGKIPAIQIGGRYRIKKSSLDRDVLRQDKQGQPTVLVVDDDPVLQDLFQTFLKQIGFSRVVVGKAKEAIKCLRAYLLDGDLLFYRLYLGLRFFDGFRKAPKFNCATGSSKIPSDAALWQFLPTRANLIYRRSNV